MLHAVSFALLDSVNGLLIGVVVAIGILLPRGVYRRVAPLLILGDFSGVFALSVVTMLVLDSLRGYVEALKDSPVMGWILIVVGLASAVMTWRSRPGESSALVERIISPLKEPSIMTFLTGFGLGVIQSITSVPFFMGLIYLAAGDFSAAVRYGGLLAYATLALSLPAISAAFVAWVRAYPDSYAGQLFTRARENKHQVAKVGGYVVAFFLIAMGLLGLTGLSH